MPPRLRATLALSLSIFASAAEAALSIRWENTYGNPGRNYNPSAIGTGGGGAVFIAGASAAPGIGGAEPEFWLWKIDASGKLLTETIIGRGQGGRRINPSADHVRDMATTANGGGALIIEFQLGEPYFVAFDEAAQIRLTRRLQLPESGSILLQRLFAQDGRGFIGVGTSRGKAIALRIGAEGEVIQSATFSGVDAFTDAAKSNGSILAVGHSAAKPGQFAITSFGADLSGEKTVWHKGGKASIASGSDGGQVVVYDASADDIQDVRIATVKKGALEDEIAVPASAPAFLPKFEMARLPGDRHLAAGTTQEGLAVLVFAAAKAQGRIDTGRDHQPRHWMLKRVLGEPAMALTVVYTGGKELTTLVGVIRFNYE